MRDDETTETGRGTERDGTSADEHQNRDGGDARDGTRGPTAESITASAPEEFGLVQLWWGDGKGKTTASLGMGLRAAGHGHRVHLLQFMKGGTGTVEDVRGEYNAIAATPGYTYENSGHYGWHGFLDGSDDDEHAARAEGGLARARELVTASAGRTDEAIPLDAPSDDGVHMLILDEINYAANRGLVAPEDVRALIDDAPDGLELVLTGGHEQPAYADAADLVSEVRNHRHPIENGQAARKGTEY